MVKNKPVVLIILDGFGVAAPSTSNAITTANTPNLTRLHAHFPHSTLDASGEAVGLPNGEPGNSEVGHLNLGAGRIVYQDLPRINMAIADGTFIKNPQFINAINNCNEQNSNLHLMGLVGAGSVHSSINHLYALLWLIKQMNFTRPVYLHLFTDGRDSPPTSANIYIREVLNKINEIGIGKIATISGRYYAMDRDNRWDRTQKAYEAIVLGIGETADSPLEAVSLALNRGETDEFIKPTVINHSGIKYSAGDKDSFIFYNFRTDRPRQLVKAFVLPNFENIAPKKMIYDPYKDRYLMMMEQENENAQTVTFKRKKILNDIFFVTMTEYEKGLPVNIAFPLQNVKFPLAAVISTLALRQLHISETEKYAHVTYFFNGGREDAYSGEDRIHVPSQKVATYDLRPEMSAREIAEIAVQRINSQIYDFIVINFANPDMVGHTGNFSATVRAVEVIDECIGKVIQAVMYKKGAFLITGDHGKAECMLDDITKEKNTYHSHNPVPLIIGSPLYEDQPQKLNMGILADIAPTVLKLMGIPLNSEMTGRVLI